MKITLLIYNKNDYILTKTQHLYSLTSKTTQMPIFWPQTAYNSCMKIVFCGGGTAGHVTPNFALMEKLLGCEMHYIGTNGMEKHLVVPYLNNGTIKGYHQITAGKLKRKFTLSNLLLPFTLAKSIRQSKQHLKKLAPDVVFSKGGFVGLPVVIAAKKLKIPTIVHESDMSLGLANKISSWYATKLLTTFPCKKGQVVGAIVRQSVLEGNRNNGLKIMGFDGTKPILLVMGGSLGAGALNDAIVSNPQLADKFDIFVITGKGKQIDCDFVHQAEFVDNIADIFSACDICLTRAGSNSLVELTLANVPFVAVPLTKDSRGEQIKNAKWFAQKGCGIHLEESNLDKLAPTLLSLYENRATVTAKQRQCSYLNGTDKVVEEILKYK